MKKINKSAFTLAEVVITMSLLAVIVAVLIPVATKTSPSANKVALKSAYGILTSTVESLINNENLYPSQLRGVDTNISTLGFTFKDKTAKVVFQEKDEGAGIPEISEDYVAPAYNAITNNCMCTNSNAGLAKLVAVFACSMNIMNVHYANGNMCAYRTTNGMEWTVTSADCSSTALNTPCMTVHVDVNGDASPNRTNCSISDGQVKEPTPDQYDFNVYYDGNVKFNDSTASSSCGVAILKEPTKNRKNR